MSQRARSSVALLLLVVMAVGCSAHRTVDEATPRIATPSSVASRSSAAPPVASSSHTRTARPSTSLPTNSPSVPLGVPTSASAVAGSPSVSASSAPPPKIPSSPDPSSRLPARGAPSLPLPQCRAATLRTVTPGTLTFATGPTPAPPWFDDADPADGRGYEAAVAAEVAATLGYDAAHVAWRSATAGPTGSDPFDVRIDRVPIPNLPGAGPDLSTGYFGITSTVLAREDSTAARVRRMAGLRGLRLAAVPDTVAVAAVIGTDHPATAVPDAGAAVSALLAGTVDAIVLTTPDALRTVADEPNLTAVGVLPTGRRQPAQFGMQLRHGSPLTACLSAAIDAMRAQGDLDALLATWLPPWPVLG